MCHLGCLDRHTAVDLDLKQNLIIGREACDRCLAFSAQPVDGVEIASDEGGDPLPAHLGSLGLAGTASCTGQA